MTPRWRGRRARVTQVRSAIGTKPKHRGTLRALGLRGIGQHNELPDRPEIRGMLARVPHLIVTGGGGRGGRREAPRALAPPTGRRRPKRRVGRGIGGKGGKTAGRGTKGQKRPRTPSRPASRAASCP